MRKVPSWVIYLAVVIHISWLFYSALTGALGVEPIKALEHAYGEAGLKLIVAGLVITPLRRFGGLNLLRFRRAVGLGAFAYICAHLLVWLVLDVQNIAQVWSDIAKRPYITIGMAGFAVLLPLALTSNNTSVRRMGTHAWRRLHRLTYIAAVLGAVHYVMLVKGIQIEPLIYLGLIGGLLMLRLKGRPALRRA